VQLFHSEKNFGEKYLGLILAEFHLGQMIEEFAAGVELQ
jgi:hypothetical protein